MKDVIGNVLSLGDTVVTNSSGYSDLQVGKIIKFTPKMAKVRYGQRDGNTKLCSSDQIALVEREVAVMYWLGKGTPF